MPLEHSSFCKSVQLKMEGSWLPHIQYFIFCFKKVAIVYLPSNIMQYKHVYSFGIWFRILDISKIQMCH